MKIRSDFVAYANRESVAKVRLRHRGVSASPRAQMYLYDIVQTKRELTHIEWRAASMSDGDQNQLSDCWQHLYQLTLTPTRQIECNERGRLIRGRVVEMGNLHLLRFEESVPARRYCAGWPRI